jgi:hypothetical protein
MAHLRPVAATLTVLAVACLGALGAWAAVKSVGQSDDDRITVPPAAAPVQPSSAPATSAAPSRSPSRSQSPTVRATPELATQSPAEIPSGSAREEDYLWSDASIAPESTKTRGLSNITLKNQRTLSTVEVTIRIAITDGLSDAGAWSTMPSANYTVSLTHQPHALIYQFVLNPGVTLDPGTYVFTAQYDHPSGAREADDDAYLATASSGSSHVRVYGNFEPVN